MHSKQHVVYTCVNMNADDTEPHCSGADLQLVQDDFQSDINQIQTWLQANRLQLNVSKSVITMLGSWQKLRHSCVVIYLNGKALAQVTTIRYLGVIIDQNLT